MIQTLPEQPQTSIVPIASVTYTVENNAAHCLLSMPCPQDYFIRIREVTANPQIVAESVYKQGMHTVSFSISHKCSVTIRVHEQSDDKVAENIAVAMAHVVFFGVEERTGRAAFCKVIDLFRMQCIVKESKEK